jgi:hypothetical protein
MTSSTKPTPTAEAVGLLERVLRQHGLRVSDDGSIEQRCTGCGEWLPATAEFFHLKASSPRGIVTRCRPCRNEDAQRRHRRRTSNGTAAAWGGATEDAQSAGGKSRGARVLG